MLHQDAYMWTFSLSLNLAWDYSSEECSGRTLDKVQSPRLSTMRRSDLLEACRSSLGDQRQQDKAIPFLMHCFMVILPAAYRGMCEAPTHVTHPYFSATRLSPNNPACTHILQRELRRSMPGGDRVSVQIRRDQRRRMRDAWHQWLKYP